MRVAPWLFPTQLQCFQLYPTFPIFKPMWKMLYLKKKNKLINLNFLDWLQKIWDGQVRRAYCLALTTGGPPPQRGTLSSLLVLEVLALRGQSASAGTAPQGAETLAPGSPGLLSLALTGQCSPLGGGQPEPTSHSLLPAEGLLTSCLVNLGSLISPLTWGCSTDPAHSSPWILPHPQMPGEKPTDGPEGE